MKRVGGLWSAVTSWENLFEALRRAALGKKKRPEVAAFLFDQESRLGLVRDNVVRFRRRLRQLQAEWAEGSIDWAEVQQSIAGWTGHAKHGDTWRLQEQILSQAAFPARGLDLKKFRRAAYAAE